MGATIGREWREDPGSMQRTLLRLPDVHVHRAVHVAPLVLRTMATLEVFHEFRPTPQVPRVLACEYGFVERTHVGAIWVEGARSR